MANYYLVVDSVTGRTSRGGQSVSGSFDGFFDQEFDVGVGGQTQFVVTQTFTADSKIDVYVGGVLKREGASYDFQRNVGANRIDFNFTVPQTYWVRVRVFV